MMRQIFAAAAALCAVPAWAANNGVALIPPRGWSTWNAFHRNISDALFREMAAAMQSTGLQAAGYQYLNIDGGYWAGVDTGHVIRNASGFMQVDLEKFPYDMPPLVSYLHSLGYSFGAYTDAGKSACNGDAPMSEGYEAQDVALFINGWGADSLKIDNCAVAEPNMTAVMAKWATLVNATGRRVLLSNCRNGCLSQPGIAPSHAYGPWCGQINNMWRVSSDINATWASMLWNIDATKGLGNASGPGAWRDSDFLEIGIGEFAWQPAAPAASLAINQAHMALWAVTSNPLIFGMDIRPAAQPAQQLIDILLNPRVLRINSEYNAAARNAGDVVTSIVTPAGTEVWAKPLLNGTAAAVLLNRASSSGGGGGQTITAPFADLPGLQPAATAAASLRCDVTDVWSGAVTRGVVGGYTAPSVPPRAAAFVLVGNCTAA